MPDTDARPTPASIEVSGVSKLFGEFAALRDVSFTVKAGTIAAFLGPNGAGKSTTMRILTGFLAPTAGMARIGGLDPTDAEQRIRLARVVGYLPENGPMYRDMTPWEALEFFGEARGMTGLEKAIDRVVEQCAIGQVMHKPIYKLSKGYRQRVGMAQALLHDPDVLILDEPTSGLDPLQIREVRHLIRGLGRTKTILLSTHILQEVDAIADEVVMIHEGRIVFTGTKDALKSSGSLEERFYELTGSVPKEEVA